MRRRRSTVLATAVLAVLCTSCGTGSQASDGDPSAAGSTTAPSACGLVPDDLVSAILGTDRRQQTSGPVRAGTGVDGDPGTTCTISSRAEKDRFLRLEIRTPADDVAARRERLRSGPLNPGCAEPRRFDDAGGVGVVCVEDRTGATTTRLTSVWGEQEVQTQVTRPGGAESGDADSVWALARDGHAAYVDALAKD